jgi:hypothetical protein
MRSNYEGMVHPRLARAHYVQLSKQIARMFVLAPVNTAADAVTYH